jgi:hypothetical protein
MRGPEGLTFARRRTNTASRRHRRLAAPRGPPGTSRGNKPTPYCNHRAETTQRLLQALNPLLENDLEACKIAAAWRQSCATCAPRGQHLNKALAIGRKRSYTKRRGDSQSRSRLACIFSWWAAWPRRVRRNSPADCQVNETSPADYGGARHPCPRSRRRSGRLFRFPGLRPVLVAAG